MLGRIVLLVLAVAVAVVAYGRATRDQSTASATQVRNDVADTRLWVAARNVETWHRINDTFADAPTGLNNVTLASGDERHYCVQDSRWHLFGPGGSIAPGPCS
jgi:Flp pilus assembly protein CpaB